MVDGSAGDAMGSRVGIVELGCVTTRPVYVSLRNGFSTAEWKTFTDLSDFVYDGVDCMFLLPSGLKAPLLSETP